MGFFENIRTLFSGKISDEEVEANEWILCPKCNTNILKEDAIEGDMICPVCKTDLPREE